MRECPVWFQAQRAPHSVALVFSQQQWTWGDAHRAVNGAVARLKQLGVGASDTVAMCSWNRPEAVWLFWACARLGATLVPLNARLTAGETGSLLSRVESRSNWGELPDAASFSSLAPGGTESGEISEDSVAVALFTSGTTGVPKLVELSHGNFLAAAAAHGARLGIEANQRWLCALPLFHIGGLAMMYRCAVYGASLVLERQFDAASMCRALDEGVTHCSVVPTMLSRLLKERGGRSFSGIHAVLVGGGPVPLHALHEARRLGLPVLQTYGLTEACSQVSTERLEDADGQSAGPPLPGIEVRIVGADEAGVGEIEVRGATVAASALTAGNGWLRTGDLGKMDSQGRVQVMARREDLIISGGENIYPAEVEAVLAAHPGVFEVAVAAQDDEEWGQRPVAYVVAQGNVSPSELERWAASRMARFKIPARWILVDSLPRTASGKISRSQLREHL